MAGVPASAFTQTVRITGPTVLTGSREYVNDAAKNNYNTEGYLMRGARMSDVIQGGTSIIDDIKLSYQRKARPYRPGSKQQYSNPQTGTRIAAPWRMFITDITWDDTERELNEGAAREGDRGQRMKDIWFSKQQDARADWHDFTEEQYWAVPDKTRMEDANGDSMYSIPALINRFASGLCPSTHPGGAWTTKLGIDPTGAGNSRWDNQRLTYDNILTGTSQTQTSLLTILKRMFAKLDLRPPPTDREYFEQETAEPSDVVFCSEKAQTLVWKMYLAAQNRWSDQMDPFGNPVFSNVSFVRIGVLDTALIFPSGAAGALGLEDATANSNAGGNYWCVRTKYLRKFYHSRFTMHSLGVMDDRAQPTSHTMPMLTWCNVFPRSLFRHGHISPSANITGY